jgi:hypothetical protein
MTLLLLLSGFVPSAAVGQRVSGSYVLTREGSEVLAVRLTQTVDGRVSGTATSGGASQSVTGSASGARVTLTMTTADGGTVPVTGTLDGDRLTLTFGSGAVQERQVLTRRGVGWSDVLPAARQWQTALVGRQVTLTERTGGGSSGGATTQRTFAFCSGGTALLEVASALSVYVPGATGGQTSRESARLRWRVIARGTEVSVEFTNPEDGDAFQLGLGSGEGNIIRFGETMARLTASSKCG